MPELPDITVYIEKLQALVRGRVLQRARMLNAFVLRTAVPPIASSEGRTVAQVQRLGKRVVLVLEGGPVIVIHLMIAGRLRWLAPAARQPGKLGSSALAVFEFDNGQLVLTEAGTTRRASIHVVPDGAALQGLDPGGIDVMACTPEEFEARLRSENHTLKRALTDPRLFSGIGNAYSDEILHRARLSPVSLTRTLPPEAVQQLLAATRTVMNEWTDRLRAEADRAGGWPEKVTAFHPQMAVHGRYGQPCPVCGTPVQRILHAASEHNYCARCQTGGKLLADRALSRLLKASWPKTVDDL